ncbi:Arsenite/antimonite efflux pump membrane protein, ArsB [Kalmanozyma brasiliensis GHG001]|uniref:Citrate transporter-like domain-containing protein n=1 Tax=Kalmanozyma brasiliensis (strain GHG001) TaxID=1365824 RepID=V5E7J2_KALBG|nr:Arsenite/antimonite efflux pump membrane protein, ArsB [Kalmanozyma brasiliensis GHG001]EST06266.1 Arsenite/antimonite efflux pump membrane protein, ArsB [Kalmanozyma brasiliensis GHG001]
MEDPILISKRAESAGQVTVDSTRTSLNGFGVFAIIVFAVVSLIVIHPIRIPIPAPIASFLRQNGRKIWLALAGPPDADEQEKDAVERELGQDERNDRRPMHLTIDHVSAPVIGVIVLLATTTIGGEQVRQGIVGEDGIEPYDVLALFISLAYIAISLDATGLLRFLAFLICLKAGRKGKEAKGKTLYLLLYFFFWGAGVLVGNDPVILSGTAFLVYFTRVAGISPPDAWIWAEFVAANISSAVLVSSNPTNLVIATGFDVNFITYTAYMVLPAFGSAVGGLCAMMIYFRNREDGGKSKDEDEAGGEKSTIRKIAESVPVIGSRIRNQAEGAQIRQRSSAPLETIGNGAAATPDRPYANNTANGTTPASETNSIAPIAPKKKRKQPLIYIPETIIRPDVDPRAALVDKTGAIFGSIVMAATLATLVGTSVIGGVKVFEVAVPGAVLCFVRDGVADWLRWRKSRLEKSKPEEAGEGSVDSGVAPQAGNEDNANGTVDVKSKQAAKEVEEIELKTLPAAADGSASRAEPSSSSSTATATAPAPARSRNLLRRLIHFHHRLTVIFPTVTIVLSRLPFPLLPFAFSMFILVQALAHVGFINILSSGLGRVCSSGYVPTAFFISFLGIVLCNIGGTNIGATILLTKSVRSPYFAARIAHLSTNDQQLIEKVAQYSIAFGSNVGALGGTFAASLAGLLWLGGLKQGGIRVRAGQFLRWCAVVVGPSTVIGIAIIVAEVRYFHVSA